MRNTPQSITLVGNFTVLQYMLDSVFHLPSETLYNPITSTNVDFRFVTEENFTSLLSWPVLMFFSPCKSFIRCLVSIGFFTGFLDTKSNFRNIFLTVLEQILTPEVSFQFSVSSYELANLSSKHKRRKALSGLGEVFSFLPHFRVLLLITAPLSRNLANYLPIVLLFTPTI